MIKSIIRINKIGVQCSYDKKVLEIDNGGLFFEMKYFDNLKKRLLFILNYEDEIPSEEELEEALDTNLNKFVIKPHKF